MLTFKQFLLERDLKSSDDKPEAEDYLSGISRELGIKPDDLPSFIDSGPIAFPEEGLWFNQSIWQIIKPVHEGDQFVRMRYHKSSSPNLDSRVYRRDETGKMVPYEGAITNRTFLVPIKKFSELFSRGFQQQAPAPGGLPGMPPI